MCLPSFSQWEYNSSRLFVHVMVVLKTIIEEEFLFLVECNINKALSYVSKCRVTRDISTTYGAECKKLMG